MKVTIWLAMAALIATTMTGCGSDNGSSAGTCDGKKVCIRGAAQ